MTKVRIRFRPPPDQPVKYAKRCSYTIYIVGEGGALVDGVWEDKHIFSVNRGGCDTAGTVVDLKPTAELRQVGTVYRVDFEMIGGKRDFLIFTVPADDGTVVDAADYASYWPWFPITARADEVRNGATRLAVHAELHAPVEAKSEYAFELEGAYSSPTAAPGLTYGFYGPSGQLIFSPLVPPGAGESASGSSAATGWAAAGHAATFAAGARGLLLVRGRVYVSEPAGMFGFGWAQATATSEDTIFHKGAILRLRRVGPA